METTAAVILTHNRPDMLADCIRAIGHQVDFVVVVDNASDPSVEELLGPELTAAAAPASLWLMEVPDQPPNISRMWNGTLDLLGRSVEDPRWVAFLCDDTTPPDGWVKAIVDAMQETGAAAGCSNPWGHQHPPRVKTEPDGDIIGRMPGWAFILDAHKRLRADETMHWWFCDSDLDWQARQAGGMVMVGGFAVPNHRPGEFTNAKPELGERAGKDRQAFADKYGAAPW